MPRKLAPFFVLLTLLVFALSLTAYAKPEDGPTSQPQTTKQDPRSKTPDKAAKEETRPKTQDKASKEDARPKAPEKAAKEEPAKAESKETINTKTEEKASKEAPTKPKKRQAGKTKAEDQQDDAKEENADPAELPAPIISKEEHEQIKEQLQETASIPDLVEKARTAIETIHTDLVNKQRLAAPWRERWNESRNDIKKVQIRAQTLTDQFAAKGDLLNSLASHERHLSQILPSINTYREWASPMEAVNSRLGLIIKEIDQEYHTLYEINAECEVLLKAIVERSSITVKMENEGEEFKQYQQDLKQTEAYIQQTLKKQKADLEPITNLKKEILKIQQEIEGSLPELWKNYYLRPPLNWLDGNIWASLSHQFDVFRKGIELRQTLEFPTDRNEWRRTLLRGLLCIVLFTILLIIISRQSFVPIESHPDVKHCFTRSLPVICLGITLILSSISPRANNFHFFLSLGNIILIFGQMLLAWDLRLMSSPNTPRQASPLLRLYPLTCIAYVLLYLPLLQPVLLVLWLFFLIATLIWRHFWTNLDIGELHLEKHIRTADGFFLWICLILTVLGMHMYSLILYLLCVSVSLAIELCKGGFDRINYLNDNQPSEGISAILSGILISLAAPILMLVAVISVLLWIATLPGGIILTKEYLLTNVSVGSAEFNFVHVLIIISAFFLTKAIVSAGIRYIERVVTTSKTSVDTTLVTPAQTAFTYIVWIIFAIFVLQVLDIDLKNAAMVATGLSVGIGMGLQNIVQNFFSGLLLIFGRMLQVGDVIEVKGVLGQVSKISVRDTLVRTFENAYIYVPNSEFISGHLVNWSRNDTTVRGSVSVGVAYGTNTALVIKTLRDIAHKNSTVLRYPEPSVFFQDFGDNTLQFTVYFWVNEFADRAKTCNDIRLEIDKQFKEKEIEIAFPQLDVHMKTEKLTPKPKEKPRTQARQFALRRPVRRLPSERINLRKSFSQ